MKVRGVSAYVMTGTLGVALCVSTPTASAEDSEEDDSEIAGGEDEASESPGDDGAPKQPAVTAGGLFTKQNYPASELARPLTISKGIFELRAGLGADVSADTAFEAFSGLLEARYGVQDNFELSASFELGETLVRGGVAVEAALAYDLLNIRLGAVGSRSETALANGDTQVRKAFEVELGFPLRYAFKPEFGVVALDTLLTLGDGKPDLTPAVAVIGQPLPSVSLLLRAKMIIPDLDVDAEGFVVPGTIAVQTAAGQTMDVGLEFTFKNMKPPEGMKFYDQREMLLYVKARM